MAFIGLGLPDTLSGVAWPGVRDDLALAHGGLGLIPGSTAGSRLARSFPA